MPNLFPEDINLEENSMKEIEEPIINLKGTYSIDFKTGELNKNLDGTIKVLDKFESYIQWCNLAMMTIRYRYMAYSDKFGRDIIGSNIDDKNVIELEIKRITQEALMVHPLTKSVDSFNFEWRDGEVYYRYEVTTVDDNKSILANTEKVRW